MKRIPFVLMFVIVFLSACAAPNDALYGKIPIEALELSQAIHGTAQLLQLADGRLAIDVSDPGSKERIVVTQSYSGEDSQVLTNPRIIDENPPEYLSRNLFTDKASQTYLPVGLGSSFAPSFWGAFAGMVVFACADWGVGLIKSGGTVINTAAKAGALRIPEAGGTELLSTALKTGRITVENVDYWVKKGFLTEEAGVAIKEQIGLNRPVFFETDAVFAGRYLTTALKESDTLLLPVEDQVVRAVRSTSNSLRELPASAGPVRLGRVWFSGGAESMSLEWVPSIGKSDLHFDAKTLERLIQQRKSFPGNGLVGKQATQLRSDLVEMLRPRGYCGIQVDGVIDALSQTARDTYEKVAATDASWMRFRRGSFWESGNPSDWQSWIGSPARVTARREVEQAIKNRGETDPKVIDGVWHYVEGWESSSVPVVSRVGVEAGNIPETQAVKALPAPKPPVALLAAPQIQSPLLLTAGESVSVPISEFMHPISIPASSFIPVR